MTEVIFDRGSEAYAFRAATGSSQDFIMVELDTMEDLNMFLPLVLVKEEIEFSISNEETGIKTCSAIPGTVGLIIDDHNIIRANVSFRQKSDVEKLHDRLAAIEEKLFPPDPVAVK